MELDVKEFYEGDAHHGTWDMVLLILAIVSFCYMMVIINMKLTMEILVLAFVHSLVKGSHYRKLRGQVVNVCYCLKYLNLFNEFEISSGAGRSSHEMVITISKKKIKFRT